VVGCLVSGKCGQAISSSGLRPLQGHLSGSQDDFIGLQDDFVAPQSHLSAQQDHFIALQGHLSGLQNHLSQLQNYSVTILRIVHRHHGICEFLSGQASQ
jgi:hypothetical protein